MVVSPSPDQLVTGRVAAVNPKGLKLDGGANWLNFSKFATDLVPPMRGQFVTLTLDRQGFIRAVCSRSPAHGSGGSAAPRSQTSPSTPSD